MIPKPKRHIIPQMFDVRPVRRSGGLDWERIRSVGSTRTDTDDAIVSPESSVVFPRSRVSDAADECRHLDPESSPLTKDRTVDETEGDALREIGPDPSFDGLDAAVFCGRARAFLSRTFIRFRSVTSVRPIIFAFSFLLFLALGAFFGKQMVSLKGEVLGESTEGMERISRALDALISADFESAADRFSEAERSFSDASDSIGIIGNALAKGARFIPFLSRFSSGQGLIEGSTHLASAGETLSLLATVVPGVSGKLSSPDVSFLVSVGEAERLTDAAARDLERAEKAFSRVDPDDLPEGERDMFVMVREKLPPARLALVAFREHSFLIRELLGESGPRLYLFLFQNNHELRPTGGFIGSYGLLEVSGGRVRKFFVDGIFNPDGQFGENIVPPAPVRKVSATWSLHDSNWWPDFPRSAEKAISFYEKTGGPTVDGVVTLTPSVIRDLLRITGPIEMPEYGVTIGADTFMSVIQQEVEVDYDRTLNRPKQILADLAPVLFDRLLQSRDMSSILSLSEILDTGLSERQMLLYSRNEAIQSLVRKAGWSGELLSSSGDYASVVHTNLNGYKTDGVIEETVEHVANVRADGSVLDTLRITRKHTGGGTDHDWWNRVNSDYMRVYVPFGSELLSVSGQTYELNADPVDYDALGFRRDPDVEQEERATVMHESGTRISEESGKTVFGNWVYVSPGESVTVEYSYLLPFRVFPENGEPSSYAFLYQKQAGVEWLDFSHTLAFPDRFVPVWHSENLDESREGFTTRGTISRDVYVGSVFLRR